MAEVPSHRTLVVHQNPSLASPTPSAFAFQLIAGHLWKQCRESLCTSDLARSFEKRHWSGMAADLTHFGLPAHLLATGSISLTKNPCPTVSRIIQTSHDQSTLIAKFVELSVRGTKGHALSHVSLFAAFLPNSVMVFNPGAENRPSVDVAATTPEHDTSERTCESSWKGRWKCSGSNNRWETMAVSSTRKETTAAGTISSLSNWTLAAEQRSTIWSSTINRRNRCLCFLQGIVWESS